MSGDPEELGARALRHFFSFTLCHSVKIFLPPPSPELALGHGKYKHPETVPACCSALLQHCPLSPRAAKGDAQPLLSHGEPC